MTDNAAVKERPGKRPTNGAKGAPIKNIDMATVKRLFGYFRGYRLKMVLVLVCIVLSTLASVSSSLFLKSLIDDYIEPLIGQAVPNFTPLIWALCGMGCLYLTGILSSLFYNRVMAEVTQGVLKNVRDDMFEHMQTLPVKYFDTHTHGDVMSYYTNEPVQGTEDWHDITALALGDDFIIGLTAAGDVLAAGQNQSVIAGVKGWRHVTQIAAVSEAAAALTAERRVLCCGSPRILRYDGAEDWRDIRSLIAYQNGGSVFVGLDGSGQAHFCGKWSSGALCRTDSIDPVKWSGLRRVWQEGYYLLGEKEDGSVIYESTPTERTGQPPVDDHITDWGEVADWVIEGEYLMAIRHDGSVGWEGISRRPQKRRITEGWRDIRRCLLWRIAGGRSNAMAVDAAGRLFSDQSDPAAERFFGQFSGVRRIAVFQPFLLVLHGSVLSFVLYGKNGWERHDLLQVQSLLTAEEGKTVVVTFADGRVRSFGQTLYDSTVDPTAKNVRFYGDRSAYLEKDTDPFRHFEGVIGLQGEGQPFILSAANRKGSESFYSVQQLMYVSAVRGAVAVEPMGDLLLADGTCRSRRGDLFAKWVGITQLCSCSTHTVGVTNFRTAVVYGDGEYGSCSVDAYMNVVQAFALPHATVLRQSDGTLISLCEKLSETPYEPLPVTSGVTAMAMTGSHFALLCADGSLWCCEAQAFADKIRWRGSSEYYTRPWGKWQKLFTDAVRMTVTGEEIRIWRHDTRYSFMEPTVEKNALSGQEPTIQ